MENFKEKYADSEKEYDVWGDDNHDGNIGMYRNKAVVFDW
jgi:hypothetical protein